MFVTHVTRERHADATDPARAHNQSQFPGGAEGVANVGLGTEGSAADEGGRAWRNDEKRRRMMR